MPRNERREERPERVAKVLEGAGAQRLTRWSVAAEWDVRGRAFGDLLAWVLVLVFVARQRR